MYLRAVTSLAVLAATAAAHLVVPNDDQDMSGIVVNGIPYSTRVKYMRLANEALYEQSGPCPFAAFGTIIVNHTSDSVVCRGANFRTGDPTIHGEISAINACTAVFAAKNMTATQIFAAWADLSIYTNAESCPMCASAIRWAGFKEYIYGTTIQHNYNAGWGVITLSSYDVFQQTRQLPGYQTVMLGQILTNETDSLFSWQYDESEPCPNGCVKELSKTRGYLGCVTPNYESRLDWSDNPELHWDTRYEDDDDEDDSDDEEEDSNGDDEDEGDIEHGNEENGANDHQNQTLADLSTKSQHLRQLRGDLREVELKLNHLLARTEGHPSQDKNDAERPSSEQLRSEVESLMAEFDNLENPRS